MRIGILGGSFNPPHLGHLSLARTVLGLELVDRVCFIPAAVPPHKARPDETPETRLAMTRLLVEEDERLLVDDLELHRGGPSFTIDTLETLAARHPGTTYRLVIGSDLAKTFATWREYSKILRLAPPLVAERPDSLFQGIDDYPGLSAEEIGIMTAGRFAMEHVDISSTLVRRLVGEGADDETLLTMLTPAVLRYVRERHLYENLSHS